MLHAHSVHLCALAVIEQLSRMAVRANDVWRVPHASHVSVQDACTNAVYRNICSGAPSSARGLAVNPG